MAVQAQYMMSSSPVLRVNKNIEEFHTTGNRFYNHGGQQQQQQQLLNGTTVFSEPESELITCNNINIISGSRKRNRDDHHSNLLSPQILINQNQFRFPKIQDCNRSEVTCTSGRSYGDQNLEIDAFIQLENEKLRSGIEEARKRHCRSLLSILELQVLKKLEEKENELANASKRNEELEEKIKQLNEDNQIWFNIATKNESIVCTLKSSLEQILIQNHGQLKEGYGDSQSIMDDDDDDDAQSSSSSSSFKEEDQKKYCKVCNENEVSVLLLPCRHLCLCKNCESKLHSCPICNSFKNASLQIFIS